MVTHRPPHRSVLEALPHTEQAQIEFTPTQAGLRAIK
jgi:hypothetical protein